MMYTMRELVAVSGDAAFTLNASSAMLEPKDSMAIWT